MGPQDTLTIDPIAMNVVSRIASGCRVDGHNVFEGGLLVQGELGGSSEIRGRLIVWKDAVVTGRIRVLGDLYLFGQLGQSDAAAGETVLHCHGTAWVASTGVSTGTLHAQRLQLYEGADLQGPFHTLPRSMALPVLDDRPADPRSVASTPPTAHPKSRANAPTS
jgi:hypothetical protein